MKYLVLCGFLAMPLSAVAQDDVVSEQGISLADLELGAVEIVNDETGEVVDSQIIDSFGMAKSTATPFGGENLESATKMLEEMDLKQLKEVVVLGLDIVDTVFNWLEKKKPIVLVENKPLSFVPTVEGGGYVTPTQMAGWRAPVKISYSLVFKNLFGVAMAKVQLSPSMIAGGSYKGKGAYIQGVQVASQVTAHWGITAKVQNDLVSVTNAGTEENPVIACVVNAKVSVGTIISQIDLTYPVYFSADGSLKFL